MIFGIKIPGIVKTDKVPSQNFKKVKQDEERSTNGSANKLSITECDFDESEVYRILSAIECEYNPPVDSEGYTNSDGLDIYIKRLERNLRDYVIVQTLISLYLK